jgi:hypothetical protein
VLIIMGRRLSIPSRDQEREIESLGMGYPPYPLLELSASGDAPDRFDRSFPHADQFFMKADGGVRAAHDQLDLIVDPWNRAGLFQLDLAVLGRKANVRPRRQPERARQRGIPRARGARSPPSHRGQPTALAPER